MRKIVNLTLILLCFALVQIVGCVTVNLYNGISSDPGAPVTKMPYVKFDIPPQSPETQFNDNRFIIVPSSGQHGNVSPNFIIQVLAGSDQTFSINSDSGFTIDTVTIDGTPNTTIKGTEGFFTFSNVQSNHTISVTFSPLLVNDNFNDNTLNPSRWNATASGAGPSISETNQRLEIIVPFYSAGNGYGASVNSVFKMRGDIDVQADYSLLDWPLVNGIRVGMGGPYVIERDSFSAGDGSPPAPSEVYLSDFGIPSGVVATTDKAGTLRLVRVGSLWSTYYYSGGKWVIDRQSTGTTDDATISLAAWSDDYRFTHKNVRISFDNFMVNSGQVVWPG
jgi:hypothetical protein